MSSSYGKNIKMTIFGASHAPEIGVTVAGLPAGEPVDLQQLQAFLGRRAPGRDRYSTARREPDVPEFLSGLTDGRTDGTPLTAVIRNRDAHPQDYQAIADTPRPGHADYTAGIKYGQAFDRSGGGLFSGRMTAPLCVAGGIALQILQRKGISIRAEAVSIHGVSDDTGAMLAEIDAAKAEGDSVGGIVECVAEGVPAGLGGPLFDGMESRIADIVYGIPAVKGVEFGAGFAAAALKGSENNDAFEAKDGKVVTRTNRCGGILGGITTGGPLVFRAAFKPTPSIAKEQDTVDLRTMENVKIRVSGRHDPCVVLRAVPVVEAAAAFAILDALLDGAPAEQFGEAGLSACRETIDAVDAQMLRLFETRMDLAAEIAQIKKEKGLPVFDAAREQEILEKVCGRLPEELQEYGKTLFSALMNVSKDYQKSRMEEDGTC